MSTVFLSILRGLANALVIAARQTQTQADDVIASFLLELLKDPDQAADRIALFRTTEKAVAAHAQRRQTEDLTGDAGDVPAAGTAASRPARTAATPTKPAQ